MRTHVNSTLQFILFILIFLLIFMYNFLCNIVTFYYYHFYLLCFFNLHISFINIFFFSSFSFSPIVFFFFLLQENFIFFVQMKSINIKCKIITHKKVFILRPIIVLFIPLFSRISALWIWGLLFHFVSH